MTYTYDFINDIPEQGIELNQAIATNPQRDEFAWAIAKFLADGLNYDLYQKTGEKAVNSILDYDGMTIDNNNFPLLKVYRLTDTFIREKHRASSMIVGYSLLAPQQNKLPGTLNWLSVSLNHLLDAFYYSHENCSQNVELGDRKGEYKILYSEVNNFAYPFYRMPFTALTIEG